MLIKTEEVKVNDRIRKEFLDIDELAESIKELGQIQAITIDEDYNLIAGHRRLLACQKLGIDIKAEVISVKDEMHKLDMELAENVKRKDFNPIELAEGLKKRKELYEALHPETKVGQFGGWDKKTKLEKTESDISRFTQDTAKRIGKSETFVKEHLQLNDLDEELKQKVREDKLKKSEALFIQRKNNKLESIKNNLKESSESFDGLFCGDCLTEIDKIKDNSVACLIIDPPYGIKYLSNNRLEKYNRIVDDDENAFDLLDESLNKVNQKLLDNSHIYIFTSWKVIEFVKPIIQKYFNLKNCIIWDKGLRGQGDLQGNYAESYEMILFAVKGNRPLTSENRPVNVLRFLRTTSSNHPTEKPVDLIKELIKNSTIEGETVLDYFAGSGPTIVAAKETNRKYIGIEVKEEYVDIIKSRLK